MGDEASARDLLVEMQARLGRDPYEALGLVGSPSASEIRNAFLTLTKKFHPAKFARMSPEIQRLSNEVFLSLRGAHDTLHRTAAPARKSGPLPTVSPAPIPPTPQRGTPAPQRMPTGQLPTVRAPQPASASSTQPMRPFTNPRPAGAPAQRPPTAPATGPAPPTTGGGDEVAPILEKLKANQLAAAVADLTKLIARAPNVPRYHALLFYARGREHQLADRPEDARSAFLDALDKDPDLDLANTALAKLMLRRK